MSRIGKKPIQIPDGIEVKIEGKNVYVKGPKGELSRVLFNQIEIKKNGNEITFLPKKNDKKTKSFWGLSRTLVFNMIKGVNEGFEKKLEMQGVGFKARIEEDNLILDVGFSHPVTINKIEGINFSVDKNIITVEGINKELVGQVAASVRRIKPPEPYKGKGIKYLGEKIIRKVVKKAAGA